MPISKATFVNKFVSELAESNAAVFVGAGLSKAAGYVDWPGLMAQLAEEINLDAYKEADLVALAQYYLNSKGNNRDQITRALVSQFSDVHEPTESHKVLARLPLKTIWTTNYDALLERALITNGKRVDIKYTTEQLKTTKPGRDVTLYKMHGDVEHAHNAILTRDDYERYYRTHEPFITALSGALVSTTFCFLGFSFNDPNLQQILSHVRVFYGGNQRTHYCLTRRYREDLFKDKAEYEYAQTKQVLQAQDLLRFNIETVYVDEYSEVADVLADVERAYRVKTVFISGSAVEYGKWERPKTESFLSELARRLVQKKFRITTGFGLGVGGPIVTGAVQAIYSQRDGSLDDALVMRPFPIGIADAADRRATFERYREDIVSQAGIAIFILGNRVDSSGNVEVASGVVDEFRLAQAKGLWVLPIGASGYAAKTIWDEVQAAFDKNYPGVDIETRALIERLAGPVADPSELLDPLVKVIEILAARRG